MDLLKNGERVAVVAGLRTPFAKRGTAYAHLSALDLAKLCVSELLSRTGIAPDDIDQVVYGQVVPSMTAPNIAREVVLGTGMPPGIEAFSVSRACATSYQAVASATEAMLTGTIESAIAGGADSASDVPVMLSKRLSDALVEAERPGSVRERLSAFSDLRPRDLVPVPPALKEPSTGLTMGESAEKMAKENRISREAQDELAHRSHALAAKAWEEGRFDDEVMRVYVPPRYEEVVAQDLLVRKESRLEDLRRLRPVFDERHGSVTAGNSSPLTDGASAVLLMREAMARALGLDVLGFVRSYAFTAVNPEDQMLIGPAFATPLALERAGVELDDVDLIDIHEAFSAQVLSVVQAFESDAFARDKLGRNRRIGDVDWDKVNVNGGSIAVGHPFAATGTRQITQTLSELQRRGGALALCTACAAGGIGAAMVLEAA